MLENVASNLKLFHSLVFHSCDIRLCKVHLSRQSSAAFLLTTLITIVVFTLKNILLLEQISVSSLKSVYVSSEVHPFGASSLRSRRKTRETRR